MQVPIRKAGKYSSAPDPHLTPGKLSQLKQELTNLRQALPRQAAEVKRLAEMGDLSENAAYSIAKGRLRGMEERAWALERQIKQAVVITEAAPAGVVGLGCTVTLVAGETRRTFTILGSSETDPAQGIISHQSPVGVLLMGKRIGETVTLPGGTTYQVVEVR